MSVVQEVKIVILGGGGVGKSALIIRLVTDNFLEEYDPTIEDSYMKQVSIDDSPVLLDILDTAGQEEFSSMQDQWMREGQVFGLVYSICSPETLDEVEIIAEKIMRTKDLGSYIDLEDKGTWKPIVLIGNKCDLENQRQVSKKQGQDLADLWGVPFFETSAKEKINNYEAMYEMVRVLRRRSEKKTWIPPQKKRNNIDYSKIAKYVAIICCCLCLGVFMIFYYIYRFIVNRIQCCRSREQLRKAIAISKREEIERRRKEERQRLKFFAVTNLPLDTVPSPILSLKNFEIKRRFNSKRCCIAILCGVFLPIVILCQTFAFIIYDVCGKFEFYPKFYPYDNIHHSILLDFVGIIVGREPGQDPETVKNKAWFMRQTRHQIIQRCVLTALALLAVFICYYNALFYRNDRFSYMETIGPVVLFCSAWILLCIWIGYEPELYPQLPKLSRLRSIQLFFGEQFTHRTDAYKFLRAYARSRESKNNLSWKQILVIVILALFYALIPLITRLIEHNNELNKTKFLHDQFDHISIMLVIISALFNNFLFVGGIVYAIEVQYSKHFDNYREWMHDITMLLSKDTIDGKKQDADISEDLLPEIGSNFSNNLFLSLTRRSNALGWIELRSFLVREGKLLFGKQELPTLWLMIVSIILSLFLLIRVYLFEGNPIRSILFNSLAVLNTICILSLTRIAVTGYQFEFLQHQQERLWSEQKAYMRCHLSDTHQFDMSCKKTKPQIQKQIASSRKHTMMDDLKEETVKLAKSKTVISGGKFEKTSLLTPLLRMDTDYQKHETELTQVIKDVEPTEESKETHEEEQNGMIGIFTKRKKEFDSIWAIGKCLHTDDTGKIYKAKKQKVNLYSAELINTENYMIKIVDFKSLTKLIEECNEINKEGRYEIIDTCLDMENNKAMILMKEKQELQKKEEKSKEEEIQKVISINRMRNNLDGIPEELRILIQIQNVVDDKLDGINWNSYNFGFMEDLQDIVKSKDIFPRLFTIKLNSVLAKTLAGVVGTCLFTIAKVFY